MVGRKHVVLALAAMFCAPAGADVQYKYRCAKSGKFECGPDGKSAPPAAVSTARASSPPIDSAATTATILDTSCRIESGYSFARGRVQNSSDQPLKAVVEVTYTTTYGTVLDVEKAYVDVRPHDVAQWESAGPSDVKDIRCEYRLKIDG